MAKRTVKGWVPEDESNDTTLLNTIMPTGGLYISKKEAIDCEETQALKQVELTITCKDVKEKK